VKIGDEAGQAAPELGLEHTTTDPVHGDLLTGGYLNIVKILTHLKSVQ
jgi:hypothetical protein